MRCKSWDISFFFSFSKYELWKSVGFIMTPAASFCCIFEMKNHCFFFNERMNEKLILSAQIPRGKFTTTKKMNKKILLKRIFSAGKLFLLLLSEFWHSCMHSYDSQNNTIVIPSGIVEATVFIENCSIQSQFICFACEMKWEIEGKINSTEMT